MSDRMLKAFAFVAIVSLFLSTGAVTSVVRQADQREKDRVAAGVEACERGNVLRHQIITIGRADASLVRDVIDARNQVGAVTPADQIELAILIAAAFDRQRAAVDEIVQVNCPAVVPGATKERP